MNEQLPSPVPKRDASSDITVPADWEHTTLETLQKFVDREAIRQGIADLENGRVLTLEELDARIQNKLLSR